MKIKTFINFSLLFLLVSLSQGIDIDTGSLGDAGVKIYCSTSSVEFGYSIKAIGDINGDGISEFVIGIPKYNSGQGMIAIVYGSSRSSLTTFDICTNNDDSQGYTITGEPGKASWFGLSVSGAGDINGDGIPDIVVGARYYAGGGRAYIIFLNKQQTLTTIFTSPLPNEGYILTVNAGGLFGFKVDGGKDINNDGIPDVFVSTPGRVYIFYGTGTNDGMTLNLETAPSNVAYSIEGATSGGNFGVALAMCEDLNNDKISDLVVGSVGEKAIYVIYGTDGKTRSSQTKADIINSGGGLEISGSTFWHGWAISCGDINDDKIPDIVIGSTLKFWENGRVDVVFGATASSVSSFDTMNAPTEGFRITGSATPPSYLGYKISISGDINGDSIADMVVTAPGEDSGKGAVYVLFGSKTTLDDIDANDISPQSKGFKIIGSTPSSYLGDAVASNADLDCDGIDDILVSSMAESAVYLIYGIGPATKHMTNGVCKSLALLLLFTFVF